MPELIDRVARGEKILITRRGKPVAMLTPPPQQPDRDVRQVVEEMLAFRDQPRARSSDNLTIRQLIEEGRRY